MKTNCWEFKNCGRQPGGIKVGELGVCPATTEKKAQGINDGTNGGRACWCIAGTFCGGQLQGTFSSKIMNCLNCEFYKMVWKEQHEANKYLEPVEIIAKLRS